MHIAKKRFRLSIGGRMRVISPGEKIEDADIEGHPNYGQLITFRFVRKVVDHTVPELVITKATPLDDMKLTDNPPPATAEDAERASMWPDAGGEPVPIDPHPKASKMNDGYKTYTKTEIRLMRKAGLMMVAHNLGLETEGTRNQLIDSIVEHVGL